MPLSFPDGKRFAFTIFDDTDVASVENLRPIYGLLESLGMRTTKTAWPLPCPPEGSPDFDTSETLDDPAYRAYVVELQRRGFEIASHGAAMETSVRARTLEGLARFNDWFGHFPRLHANHSFNRENLYWGAERLDDPLLRFLLGRSARGYRDWYRGHVEGSEWWWGDRCLAHIEYVRNLTFQEVNLLKINPGMPYHDPKRPLVRWWFSGSDAEGGPEFAELLNEAAIDRLEREGGVCIVATHLGKGYVENGQVLPEVERALRSLAARPGWFPPTGELLDWMREQRGGATTLPAAEWRAMQWRWARDLAARKWAGFRARGR